MQDRVRINGGNGRSSTLMCPADYNPTNGFTGFLADLKTGAVYVDVTANNNLDTNAGVEVIGTPLSKASLLQDATAIRFAGDATSTPNQILGKIADQFYWNAQTATVSVPASGWSATAPYSQTIGVSNINANSNPVWDIYIPDNTSVADATDMIDSCALINKLVTGNSSITLYCYQAKPTADFQIIIKGGYGTWITN